MFFDDTKKADIMTRTTVHLHSCKQNILSLLGKYFFSRQRLNNFSYIEDRSGLRFLRTTGIISEPVAFVESRLLISLAISLDEISVLFAGGGGNLDKGWHLWSKVGFRQC